MLNTTRKDTYSYYTPRKCDGHTTFPPQENCALRKLNSYEFQIQSNRVKWTSGSSISTLTRRIDIRGPVHAAQVEFYSLTTLTEATWQNFLQIKRLNIVEVNNNFPCKSSRMTIILLPCNVQLDYKDNLLENIVNFLDFHSLNFWRILSSGLGWSSHTVKR